ncbi:unnamed protein product, partial [Staurois parvus]
MFDPVFSDPASCSPFHLLIEHNLGGTLHMLNLVCTVREVFLFFGRGACDQHRANQRCPDRGSEVSY